MSLQETERRATHQTHTAHQSKKHLCGYRGGFLAERHVSRRPKPSRSTRRDQNRATTRHTAATTAESVVGVNLIKSLAADTAKLIISTQAAGSVECASIGSVTSPSVSPTCRRHVHYRAAVGLGSDAEVGALAAGRAQISRLRDGNGPPQRRNWVGVDVLTYICI